MAALHDTPIFPVLAVDDLERAIDFYRDTLDLEVEMGPGGGGMATMKAGGGTRLGLYKSTFPRGETTVASFVVDDVEAVADELRTRGIHFLDIDTPELKTENGIATTDDGKAAWFTDSEGNTLVVSELPGA